MDRLLGILARLAVVIRHACVCEEGCVVGDHVHIGSDLNLSGAARNLVASTFDLATDLPGKVTAGCELRVQMGSTSRLPETVTCLRCREYAHRGYLAYADNIERLGPIPGMGITAAEIAEAVRAAREMAIKFRLSQMTRNRARLEFVTTGARQGDRSG